MTKGAKIPLPIDFQPTEDHALYALQAGLTLAYEVDRFKWWHTKKKSAYVNWDKTFSNWLKKAIIIRAENAQFRQSRGWPVGHNKQANRSSEQVSIRIKADDF